MTIGAALLLIAVGAILRFAITTVTTHGVDVHTIGDILMIVGVIGLVIWFFVWAPWARNRRYSGPPEQEERRPPEAYRNRERPPYPPEVRDRPPYPPEVRDRSSYPQEIHGRVYPPDDRGRPVYPPDDRGRPVYPPDERERSVYPPDDRTQEFPR
jgi:hypothetical protein